MAEEEPRPSLSKKPAEVFEENEESEAAIVEAVREAKSKFLEVKLTFGGHVFITGREKRSTD